MYEGGIVSEEEKETTDERREARWNGTGEGPGGAPPSLVNGFGGEGGG
jgi:hypothetical protein